MSVVVVLESIISCIGPRIQDSGPAGVYRRVTSPWVARH